MRVSSTPTSGDEPRTCPHCTFINPAGRQKCSVCLRKLDLKRQRSSSASTSSSQNTSQTRVLKEPAVSQKVEARAQRVETLFSTAAGRRVEVSAASLQKAEALLGTDPRDGVGSSSTAEVARSSGSGGVETLFSTAAGRRVEVSAASLQKAEALLGTDAPAPLPVAVAPTTSIAPQERTPVAPQQRRGKFRPPQKTAPSPQPPTSSTTVVGGLEPITSIRLDLALLQHTTTTSTVRSLPSLEDIASGSFAFMSQDCCSYLQTLLGVDVGSHERLRTHHWRRLLLQLGAAERQCTDAWCQQMLRSSIMKMQRLASHFNDVRHLFTPESVVVLLSYRYNEEMVHARRPALRQIAEGDAPSSSLFVVYVVAVCSEHINGHCSILQVCDGFYTLRVALDLPLTHLVRQKKLCSGRKIAICGAKLLLHTAQDPLECEEEVVLSINYNCVRPVAEHTTLGLCRQEPPPLPLADVHPAGGLIPALAGIVERVLPPFFQLQPSAPRAPRLTLNARAMELLVSNASSSANSATKDDADGRCSRILSFVLVCENGGRALLQLWQSTTMEAMMHEEAEMSEANNIPDVGKSVAVFAINPSKSINAADPFRDAKLFYCSRRIHFRYSNTRHTSSSSSSSSIHIYDSLTSSQVARGSVADFIALYVAAHNTSHGIYVLCWCADGSYILLQVPLPNEQKRIILSLPTRGGVAVLVRHAIMVDAEDAAAGADCARTFACETTHITQRAPAELRAQMAALESAAAEGYDANASHHRARRDAIFDCLSRGGGGEAYTHTASTSAPDASASSSVAGDEGSKLPYYLRASSAPNRTTPIAANTPATTTSSSSSSATATAARGVCLPPPIITASTPTRVMPGMKGATLSHFYGNIIRLCVCWPNGRTVERRFIVDATTQRPSALCDGLPDRGNISGIFMELTWRFGSQGDEERTARLHQPHVLHRLLDPLIRVEAWAALLSGDAQELDCALQRSSMLAAYRNPTTTSTPAVEKESLWWRVLHAGHRLVVGGDASMDEDARHMLWLATEWEAALELLRRALSTAFFKFSVEDDVVEMVYLISDHCDVRDLFRRT